VESFSLGCHTGADFWLFVCKEAVDLRVHEQVCSFSSPSAGSVCRRFFRSLSLYVEHQSHSSKPVIRTSVATGSTLRGFPKLLYPFSLLGALIPFTNTFSPGILQASFHPGIEVVAFFEGWFRFARFFSRLCALDSPGLFFAVISDFSTVSTHPRVGIHVFENFSDSKLGSGTARHFEPCFVIAWGFWSSFPDGPFSSISVEVNRVHTVVLARGRNQRRPVRTPFPCLTPIFGPPSGSALTKV